MAANAMATKIESISNTNVSVVYLELDEDSEVGKRVRQLDDVVFPLDSIKDLPEGAVPIIFIRDFGDASALMLTVASPRAGEAYIAPLALAVKKTLGGSNHG